jgi:hypothetical protein
VEVDLSQAILTLPKATGEGDLYEVIFDFILLFGMTELKAQVAWTENVSNLHMLVNFIRYSD